MIKSLTDGGVEPVANTIPRCAMIVNYDFRDFFKWANPASFSFIFGLFKQTSIQFLQQINVKNVNSSQYMVPGKTHF